VIGTIVIAVLALIFVFQNTGRGQVQFLFWTVTAPAWAWLLMIFVAGLIVGLLFPWLRRPGQSRLRRPGPSCCPASVAASPVSFCVRDLTATSVPPGSTTVWTTFVRRPR
jgi:hypothetical protein